MAEKKSFLRRFFGGIWAVAEFVRRTLVVLLLVLVLAVIYFAFRGGPPIEVDDGIAMVLIPTGVIVDYADADPRERVAEVILGEEPSQTRLADLLDAIDAAAQDTRIKLLFLKLDTGFIAGHAQLAELAAAIRRFRETGKPVYAYAPNMAEPEYYLAAHANEIFIDPMGLLFLTGYESYQLYVREGLDKLGVDVNVFRVGEYKSAVEPFVRDDMSDEARANARRWLDALWAGWKQQVAEARDVSVELLDDYVNNYADHLAHAEGDSARAALDAGLVNGTMTLEAVRERTGEVVGMDESHGSFRQISHRRYLAALNQAPVTGKGSPASKSVGVVTVQGQIIDGYSEPGFAGGETVSQLIRQGRDDDAVAALVLRVESPGGSVYASEQIRRALLSTQRKGKPVIVSMASVAASGGYWVSMDADRIFAHPTTITGSIGIFGLVPTFQDTLRKMGVHTDGVGTTVWSGGLSPARKLSPEASGVIQTLIEKDYSRFIAGVAEGREMDPERVEAIAGGRVWAGSDALELGLVDQLGDLDLAIDHAAAAAGLDPGRYGIFPIEPDTDFRIELLGMLPQSGIQLPTGLRQLLAGWLQLARDALGGWNDPRGSYAHCLCEPPRQGAMGAGSGGRIH